MYIQNNCTGVQQQHQYVVVDVVVTLLKDHNVVPSEGAAPVAGGQHLRDLGVAGQPHRLLCPTRPQDRGGVNNCDFNGHLFYNIRRRLRLMTVHQCQNNYTLLQGYLLPASTSWFLVFAPLFICDGLNAYFCIIVFIRQYLESQFRIALLRALWSLFVIGMNQLSK